MKKSVKTNAAIVALALLAASCSSDTSTGIEAGTGKLNFSVAADASFETLSRAVNEADYKNLNNYEVEIVDAENTSMLKCAYNQLSNHLPLELKAGSYTITAKYGTEKAASQDGFLSVGQKTIMIKPDDVITETVSCAPTCGKVSAEFDEEMSTYFESYYIAFSGTHALGTDFVTINKTNNEPYYLKLEEAGETVTYKVHLKANEEYAAVIGADKKTETDVTGTFMLKRNTAHKLNIAPDYTPTATGSISIKITIDESTNDKPVDITVPVTWI